MADLIAVAYPDKDIAREVMETLSRLQTEHVIDLADVAGAIPRCFRWRVGEYSRRIARVHRPRVGGVPAASTGPNA